MAYTVTLLAPAEKQFRKLASTTQARIVTALTELAENPRPVGCKKLGGDEGFLRVRVGDYRIVYLVDDDRRVLEVTVVRIGHRREIYRFLRR